MASSLQNARDLVLSTIGIYVCYLGYGIVQEEIYSHEFGGEKFTYSMFLVWAQCVGNGLLAYGVALYTGDVASATPAPPHAYAKIAFAYIGSMYASNSSLAFVNYPTQALAKSCKLIPVMLSRIIINKKKYHLYEYLFVALITSGIYVFSSGKAKEDRVNSYFGLTLLLISLILDAYTGPTQEELKRKYNMSETEMMYKMNFFAVILLTLGLITTAQIEPIYFIIAHPRVLWPILLFALLSAFGQAIILHALFRFDSLVVTTITTTRKFFTILASVVWFGHSLSMVQWLGVSLVFLGLAGDIAFKTSHDARLRKKHAEQKKH
jgi:UDP-galactose transporter B1